MTQITPMNFAAGLSPRTELRHVLNPLFAAKSAVPPDVAPAAGLVDDWAGQQRCLLAAKQAT
jgi:hypothetical protein